MQPTFLAVVVATTVLVGCGSNEPPRSGSTSQTQQSTAQTAAGEGEPSAPAPAGAAARSCAGGEAGLEGLRVTGIDCATGRVIAAAWGDHAGCASPAGSSRFACSVHGYRCLGTATERGISVSCARPERSIAFVARRG